MKTPTIKTLKIAKFASEETLCFEAKIDTGAGIIYAHNDGRGPTSLSTYENAAYGALQAYAETLPPFDFSKWWGGKEGDTLPKSAADAVDELVHDELDRRELKRNLKSAVLVHRDGQIYRWALRQRGRKFTHEQLAEAALKKTPDAVILNNLPMNKALGLWRKYA